MKKNIFTYLAVGFLFAACTSVKNPEYRDIQDIRVINIGMLESTAGVDMSFYNPNKFGVRLTEAQGEVYIDSAFIGRFTMNGEVSVPKRSEFVVPTLLKIDMVGALQNAQNILSKKEAFIKIVGSARVRKAGIPVNVPISYEGVQNIEKFRQLLLK